MEYGLREGPGQDLSGTAPEQRSLCLQSRDIDPGCLGTGVHQHLLDPQAAYLEPLAVRPRNQVMSIVWVLFRLCIRRPSLSSWVIGTRKSRPSPAFGVAGWRDYGSRRCLGRRS